MVRLLPILLLACAQPPLAAPAPMPWSAAVATTVEEALAPSILRDLFAYAVPTPPERGVVRAINGSSCVWAGATPVAWPARHEPRVGRQTEITWTLGVTSPAAPYAASVLASLRPLTTPIALGGMPGCALSVHPDFVLLPNVPGSLLTWNATTGVMTLRWTPAVGMAGTSVYLQLLVAIPSANAAGHVVSRAIEIHVGA
jgi:hypothetical protein